MRRLQFHTAGESHGPGLTAILGGLPAGLRVDFEWIDGDLARRQHGHGRGRRMQIERDRVEVRGGVRAGETLGSPVALWIPNLDFENWRQVMDPVAVDPGRAEQRQLRRPRPGHADLAGGLKFDRTDLRDILERASARETAARVAAGTLAKMLLREIGIAIRSGVLSLGSVGVENPTPSWRDLEQVDDSSPLRAIHREQEPAMVALVDRAKQSGDTLGGAVTVIAHGVPVGLGSHTQWDEKLDGRLAQAMLSIPAIKAMAIGGAIEASRVLGSEAHDAIELADGVVRRPTNRAGGLEGGITNGEDVVVTLFKKPISTLRHGLPSIDLDTLQPASAQYERSDVTAVPAAGVIAEAMLALVLADAVLERFGGDSMRQLLAHIGATHTATASLARLSRAATTAPTG
jgi:chorismate synthase